MRRPRVGARLAAVATAALAGVLAGVLAGCSVPREADLAAGGSTSNTSASGSPSAASGTPAASVPAVPVAPAAQGSPGPEVTATVSPSPSAGPVRAPTPVGVKGYDLARAPRSLSDPLAVAHGARDLFGAGTARAVSKSGTPVGVLLLLALRPEFVGNRAVEHMLVPKVVAGIASSGVKPRYTTWSGVSVAVASSAKVGTIVVWYSRGVLGVIACGGDPALATGYVKAYLAAR